MCLNCDKKICTNEVRDHGECEKKPVDISNKIRYSMLDVVVTCILCGIQMNDAHLEEHWEQILCAQNCGLSL